MLHNYSHTYSSLPLIRDAYLGAIRHTFRVHRGRYQQQRDQICFNDGGARFSVCVVSVVPRIDVRAMLIELNVSTYSSKLPEHILFYRCEQLCFICPISCPNVTGVSQDGVSEGEFKSNYQEELNFI